MIVILKNVFRSVIKLSLMLVCKATIPYALHVGYKNEKTPDFY